MAEQQVVDPVQQECEPDDDDESKPKYKPPAQKTVDEILSADAEDESLQKYKKSLLGNTDKFPELYPGEANVILRTMAIIIDEKVHAEVNFRDSNKDSVKFAVVEGTEYKIRLEFNVQKEICSGLKLINKIKGKGIKSFAGTKDELMVGSYKPNETTDEIHTYLSKGDSFPCGMLARGEYKVSSLFTDDDKNELCKWDWSFEIKKDKS